MSSSVGVHVQHLHVRDLLGLILANHLCRDPRGHQTVGIPQRQIESFQKREAAARVGEAAHADIRDSGHDAFVALGRFGERAGGIYGDFDLAIGAFLDLVGPGLRGLALDVSGREKDAVGQLHGLLFLSRLPAPGEDSQPNHHNNDQCQYIPPFHSAFS